MHPKLILMTLALALPLSALPSAGALTFDATPWDDVNCSDAAGQELFHAFVDPTDPTRSVAVHTLCAPDAAFDSDRGTDCPSHAYALSGWAWASRLSYRVDATGSGLSGAQVLSAVEAAGNTWDAETAADIYGTSTLGGSGSAAGRADGVSQIGWKRLSGTALVQTWTWYTTGTMAVLESDTAFSPSYAWGVNGESNKFDLQSFLAHEMGHAFGLGHPQGSGSQCLTMYSPGGYGQTYARTLGDGDIHGIEAVYGA